METTIYQFTHNRRKQPTGALYAMRMGDLVAISWSKAKTHAQGQSMDKFDRNRAIDICKNRAMMALEDNMPLKHVLTVPQSMKEDMAYFIQRCKRYFKGINI